MSLNVNAIAAFHHAVAMSDEPGTVGTITAMPPSEVLDAVRSASATYDELAASGHEVHFTTDEQSGRVAIQVLDMSGKSVGTMSPSAALHVATGGALHYSQPPSWRLHEPT